MTAFRVAKRLKKDLFFFFFGLVFPLGLMFHQLSLGEIFIALNIPSSSSIQVTVLIKLLVFAVHVSVDKPHPRKGHHS